MWWRMRRVQREQKHIHRANRDITCRVGIVYCVPVPGPVPTATSVTKGRAICRRVGIRTQREHMLPTTIVTMWSSNKNGTQHF